MCHITQAKYSSIHISQCSVCKYLKNPSEIRDKNFSKEMFTKEEIMGGNNTKLDANYIEELTLLTFLTKHEVRQ